jgi:hypothetical protein
MKTSHINTKKNRIVSSSDEKNSISNVYSFPHVTGTTHPSFSSTTRLLENDNAKNHHQFSEQDYTINLDWLQFVVTPTVEDYSIDHYNDQNLHLEKVKTHHNTNFLNCHKVVYKGQEVMEIYSNPINQTHKKNEQCAKVLNHMLYQSGCINVIYELLDILNLRFERLSRVAIALDGRANHKTLDYLNRYLKTKTIQINNDNLGITPFNFRKKDLKWDGFTIGHKRSQKYARVYNKSNELISNQKHYIIQYWVSNSIDITHNDVTRFELELGYKHLKKYNLKNPADLFDTGYLGELLRQETIYWLKIYKVKLRDIKSQRKEKAISKGKEIEYIKWSKLPSTTKPLDMVEYLPDERLNAKKSLTFSLEQIRKDPTSTATQSHINHITTISSDFGLENYVLNKINEKFPYIRLEADHPISVLRNGMCGLDNAC